MKQNVILKKDITNFLKSVKTYQKAGLGGITYHKQKWEGKWENVHFEKEFKILNLYVFLLKETWEKSSFQKDILF